MTGDHAQSPETRTEVDLRWELAERLRVDVANVNPDNVEVRRRLREVEIYREPVAWEQITGDKHHEIGEALAGLPTQYREAENSEEAKRFDLLMLRLQHAVIEAKEEYLRLREQVREIAEALLDSTTLAIPAVRKQQALLSDIASEQWWEDVTLPMLEHVRKRLRGLVKLMPKVKRGIVYSDFEDQIGEITVVDIAFLSTGTDRSRFEAKVLNYLRSHEGEPAIRKLRSNEQITADDLATLEEIFTLNGFGGQDDIDRAKENHGGLGLFLRSLTGLDREAAARAFDAFQAGKNFTANQLYFLGLLIDYLTQNGVVVTDDLYRKPFSDIAPRGPEALFLEADIVSIVSILDAVRNRAIPITQAA